MNDLAPQFVRYVGIDYSGAETPTSSLKGLRVYQGNHHHSAAEVAPPPSTRKYWTRKGLAEWLLHLLSDDTPTIVGIDHGFSFPLLYFEKYQLGSNWTAFLEDFQRHWPTDGDHVYVDFVRDELVGNGSARKGETTWRRLTERRASAAKSVFHFDVQGQVAKSTHAGLPWLLYLKRQLGERVHFWPFDGWEIPVGKSAILEIYPSLWRNAFETEGLTDDQRDAYVVAEWLRRADARGELATYFTPQLSPDERALAELEGWILGSDRVVRKVASKPSRKERRSDYRQEVRRSPEEVAIRVEQAPPAKNAALSIFSMKHPDYARVMALQEATRVAMNGRAPFIGLPLRLELRVGRAACRADGLNLINGVADVLQRRPNLAYLKPSWVFDDDANIKEFRYSETPSDKDWYEVRVAPLAERSDRRCQ